MDIGHVMAYRRHSTTGVMAMAYLLRYYKGSRYRRSITTARSNLISDDLRLGCGSFEMCYHSAGFFVLSTFESNSLSL